MQIIPAYPGLIFDDTATTLAIVPGSEPRHVVGFQRGQIRVLPDDRGAGFAPMFLDLREKLLLDRGFEEGLHGIAFHPAFPEQPRVFLSFTQQEPRRTVLSEFTVLTDGSFRADPASERVLMEVPQPLGNHWGGGIAFGQDGFLYMGLGDGGMRDDPYRLSQNLWTFHGKILRLDVNSRTLNLPYGIPADNPFVDKQEIRHEIWASGFRNPWGMSFDRKTGTLWCGDVGQDTFEEVNLVKRGGNYGWNEREGSAPFGQRKGTADNQEAFIDPIHSYGRTDGISITGGFVYRGAGLRGLRGQYLFGDWGSGRIWALSWDPKTHKALGVRQIFERSTEGPRFNPTVIAADAYGEPLLFSQSPSMIYTLTSQTLLADAGDQEEMEEIEEGVFPAGEVPFDGTLDFEGEEGAS
jgi:glucose/arabinose dehydrogenase